MTNKFICIITSILMISFQTVFPSFAVETSAQNQTQQDTSFPNTYVNSGDYALDLVGVAETQIGYTELTSKDGTPVVDSEIPYYTKYGERYGNSHAHWCAFFILWCAEQAEIPTSILCKSAACGSCKNFVKWFQNNHRWKDSSYIPQKGDIIFFDWEDDGQANHVGIVAGIENEAIITIEGNTGGENGYAVMKQLRTENILGYGIPDYALKSKLNGYASRNQTAYMLPDSSSQTVWEIWNQDELQVLCSDGNFYLVLYPFGYTGKFVAAYVPKDAVSLMTSVSDSESYYHLSKKATVTESTAVYHNASTDDLLGSQNNKIRAELNQGDQVQVLFSDGNFLFIKTDTITGYIESDHVAYTSDSILGDVNGDFAINSADAGFILRYDAGFTNLNEQQLLLGDVNQDGRTNSADAGLILRHDAGLIDILK